MATSSESSEATRPTSNGRRSRTAGTRLAASGSAVALGGAALSMAILPQGAGAASPDQANQSGGAVSPNDALAEIDSVPAGQVAGEKRDRVDAFLDREVRSGRLHLTNDLLYSEGVLPDGSVAGSVTTRGDALDALAVLQQDDGGDHFNTQIAARYIPEGSEAQRGAAGFDAASLTGAATLVSESCRSLFFDSAYSNSHDHYIYDCWQKFKNDQSSQRRWAYNRYTLFDPANADNFGERIEIVDATIRTRPWSGHASKVTGGPYSYAPNPSSSCSTYTASVGLSYGGASGGLSVPLVSCNSAISVFPNGTAHSMGTDWNGRTQGQVKIDYAFRINTTVDTEPVYADYVWMETQRCFDPVSCAGWNPSEYMNWQDAGW